MTDEKFPFIHLKHLKSILVLEHGVRTIQWLYISEVSIAVFLQFILESSLRFFPVFRMCSSDQQNQETGLYTLIIAQNFVIRMINL